MTRENHLWLWEATNVCVRYAQISPRITHGPDYWSHNAFTLRDLKVILSCKCNFEYGKRHTSMSGGWCETSVKHCGVQRFGDHWMVPLYSALIRVTSKSTNWTSRPITLNLFCSTWCLLDLLKGIRIGWTVGKLIHQLIVALYIWEDTNEFGGRFEKRWADIWFECWDEAPKKWLQTKEILSQWMFDQG